jgi:hypothetical protein
MRIRANHFGRMVARENSSNVSVPSWFVSSSSKIFFASAFSDVPAPVVEAAVPGAVFVPEAPGAVAAGDEGVAGAVGGIAVGAPEVVVDGVAVAGGDVASASVILSVIADVAATLFEVVAQAAPVAAMAQTPSAVTKFRRRAFMWISFRSRRCDMRPPLMDSLMQGPCRQ